MHQQFHANLERLIRKFGFEQTTRLFKRLLDSNDNDLNHFERQKLLVDFLALEASKVFNVSLDELFDGDSIDARDARMAITHLLKLNARLTYKQIGRHLKATKRSLMYYNRKCGDFIAAPEFYKDFCAKYEALEKRMIGFMIKIG